MTDGKPYPQEFYPGCPCYACDYPTWPTIQTMDGKLHPSFARMSLCPTCGNKRCPGAVDHRNECSGSNEPGQPGSFYEGTPESNELYNQAHPPGPKARAKAQELAEKYGLPDA